MIVTVTTHMVESNLVNIETAWSSEPVVRVALVAAIRTGNLDFPFLNVGSRSWA